MTGQLTLTVFVFLSVLKIKIILKYTKSHVLLKKKKNHATTIVFRRDNKYHKVFLIILQENYYLNSTSTPYKIMFYDLEWVIFVMLFIQFVCLFVFILFYFNGVYIHLIISKY